MTSKLKKDDSDSKDTLKPPPKFKKKDKSKNELKTEKEGLKTKLSSVEGLLKFINKKHSSGKLDDDEYVKRSKKLQSDLKKTKKRMNIIDKLLEKLPENTINEFVQSDDFEIYEKVVKKYKNK